MSTNAFIGIRENGSISYIYNHSDGYLEYLGRMLLEHYNSEEKAKALVALGGVSIVKEKLDPAEGTVHSFNVGERQDGVSVFYGRDKNEDWECIKPITIQNTVFDEHQYYNYLYDVEEGRWLFTRNGKDFQKLEEVIADERKVAKDKLYKRLVKEFDQQFGGLENQPLYKSLTLEDLQEIAGIIDRRLWLERTITKINNAKNKRKQLETNLMKLWKEKNKFLALDMKIKISNGVKICCSAAGFEKCGFEVVKGDKVLCKLNIIAKRGYDSGFTYFIQMNDEEVEQGVLNGEETAFDSKAIITEILKKEGWAEKIESYISVILEALEERKK
jgi:hypothetical protein